MDPGMVKHPAIHLEKQKKLLHYFLKKLFKLFVKQKGVLTIQVEKHIQELNIMMSKHTIFLFDLVDEKRLIYHKLIR